MPGVGPKGSAFRNDPDPPGKRVAALALRQHGVVERADLRRVGLDKWAVARLVHAGWLHVLHPGVYSVGHPSPSLLGRYLAAVKACGPWAVLSHRPAGALWEVRPSSTVIEVTVPRVTRRPEGIRVHRSRMLEPEDVTVHRGIPVTTLARTLLDLAGAVPGHHLRKALDRAERAGKSDLEQLEAVLARARGKRGAKEMRKAINQWKPKHTKSELEDRFASLVAQFGLPRPRTNAIVDGQTKEHEADAYWPDHGLVVQVDSFQFHRTRRDIEHDAASDADLELAGLSVVRLSEDDLTVRDEITARRLGRRLTLLAS